MPSLIRPGHARPRVAIAPAVPEPIGALSTKVTNATKFVAEKSYKVKLSGVATYLGSSLSPMHLHVVTGKVAQVIRASIDSFDPQ